LDLVLIFREIEPLLRIIAQVQVVIEETSFCLHTLKKIDERQAIFLSDYYHKLS